MSEKIMMFRGEYAFLSNMYEAAFIWDNRSYRNSEAAFQSAKSLDPAVRDGFSSLAGVTAKRAGRKVALRADWELVKNEIMEDVVRAKFSQNPDLLKKLLDTGTKELAEGNNWHDTYWGVDLATGKGQNHLGRILMHIREELGGAEYKEAMVRQRAEQKEAERLRQAARLQEREKIMAELKALPDVDFTGMEMNTKAFGRVRILQQDGNYLLFDVNGVTKKFVLPGCILQGFLVPDDPEITRLLRKKLELTEKLKAL